MSGDQRTWIWTLIVLGVFGVGILFMTKGCREKQDETERNRIKINIEFHAEDADEVRRVLGEKLRAESGD